MIFEEHNQEAPISETANSPLATPEAMAIVGMDAIFGNCVGLSQFEQSIYDGRQHFVPLPTKRWKGIGGTAPEGAYIDNFDFDFMRFKVPPKDEDSLIPQQLLTMKVVDSALQDAAIEPGTNVAVLVAMGTELELHQFRGRVNLTTQIVDSLQSSGITLTDAQVVELEELAKDSIYDVAKLNKYTSFIGNIMASRISSLWDFNGPAFTVSAEENSTFKCLDLAQNLLATSDVDAVVVAAVDLGGSLENITLRKQMNPLNDANQSMSFEQSVNGWSVGEGAGAVVLRRARDVTLDANSDTQVYCHIEGIGFSAGNDEASVQQACERALTLAGKAAADIGYVEAYASGNAEEDKRELEGLSAIYAGSDASKVTAIGSVKANIGHTYSASGIASVIKTALCLRNKFIPGVPNWKAPKNSESWSTNGLYVQGKSKGWLSDSTRSASVSGLGADFTAAHIVLSECADQSVAKPAINKDAASTLILVSGTSKDDLIHSLQSVKQQVADVGCIRKIAAANYVLQGNKSAKYSVALIAATIEQLLVEVSAAEVGVVKSLSTGSEWFTPSGSYFSPKPLGEKSQVCFVYPGGFASYVGLGKDVFRLFPDVLSELETHTQRLKTMIGDDLFHPRTSVALSDQEIKILSRQLVDTPIAMFESGICYAKLLTTIFQGKFKVKPHSAIGYSMGEISMMYAMDVWGSADEMSHLLNTQPVFRTRLAGPMDTVREAWGIDSSVPDSEIWAGYTIKAPIDLVKKAVSQEDKAFLLLINATEECVIAGDPVACANVVNVLDCEHFVAPMSDVIHCDIVRADYDELATLHRMPTDNSVSAKLFSAVGYKPVAIDSTGIAQNIAEMYCNPVDFPRLAQAAYDDGARVFVELGPRDSCSQYVSQALGEQEHLSVALDAKGRDDKNAIVRALAKLASHHIDIDLSMLFDLSLLDEQPKKGMVRRVELGRKSLPDSVLTSENIQRFSDRVLVNKPPVVVAQPVARLAPKAIEIPTQQSAQVLSKPTASPVVSIAPKTQVLNTVPNKIAKKVSRKISNKVVATNERSRVRQSAPVAAPSTSRVTAENIYNKDKIAEPIMTESNAQMAAYKENLRKVNDTHRDFLQSRQDALGEVAELMELQIQLAAAHQGVNVTTQTTAPTHAVIDGEVVSDIASGNGFSAPSSVLAENYSVPENIIWDTADLVEFAEGKIGKVFGPEFDVIDNYSRRVRLPTTDYLLVSRVTKLDGKVHEYKPSTMTTEYDVPTDAPYLVDGQIPWAVAVESGQCDLLLISYLGIDFTNKGDRVYRLLDCTLTFMDDLAFGGETLRYDISINSYANNGDALLFFFSYECFVGDKLVLKMDGGCAGFFTDEELADGKGVIKNEDDRKERETAIKQQFSPFLHTPKSVYEFEDMRNLVRGDTAACFGADYDKQGLNPSLCFASEKFLMIERVASIAPNDGPWGLGVLEGHKQLDPNHWYFPCHFKDDQVMAGSLMAEGCGQLLMFYMMYLGLHTQVTNARFQPIPGESQQVRCRGQVLPQHGTLVYKMEVTEIGLSPFPYAKANVDIVLNGKVVVDFKNISVMLKEQGSEPLLSAPVEPVESAVVDAAATVSRLTAPLMRNEPDLSKEKNKGVTPILHFEAPELITVEGDIADNRVPDTVPYQPYHMFEFATGDISKCFGSEFDFYRTITPPRTPCGDLQLTTRVTEVRGTRGDLKNPAYCKGEYEVPADAWYFSGNAHPAVMPYSVLMEISLQPNGFVSAWAGTTLRFPGKELFFRNLDGSGTLLREVDLRGKTIINDSNLLSTTIVGNNIVQSFDFTLSTDGEPFYEGTAVFGYFEAGALKDQLGLDKGQVTQPWHLLNDTPEDQVKKIALHTAPMLDRFYQAPSGKPHYRLAGGQLDFIDRVEIVENGGDAGKGYIFAEKTIDPTDWFFPFHFHGDPVMPGSLGVEAIIQSMQVYALENDLGAALTNPMFSTILSKVKWKYRGQINPLNIKMSLDVHITDIQHNDGEVVIIGNANLSKDGLRIYEVADIAICLKEA